MATKKIISAGTGRRKTAVARVTLVEGKGEWTVNREPLEAYTDKSCQSQQTYHAEENQLHVPAEEI